VTTDRELMPALLLVAALLGAVGLVVGLALGELTGHRGRRTQRR
jgi:hypothetical protein